MEIRQFCERLLFGTSLTDKLARPPRFEDDHPGPALGAVARPGRPPGLEIDFGRARAEFPALHELEQDEAHGRALHFFANHELLAMELMAVTLLRFPNAPAPFRLGLARIIREEQLHFELYQDRAQQLGVEIGRYALNGFFWNCLHDVGSPSEAVAALGLTLEQANLDYAAYYARAFRKIGAHETGAILERVLEDEIRHVAHGLHWFKQWLEGDEDLFAAHAARLRLPLSISRARGVGFEIEARRKAGFPAEYIAQVERFVGSRGRPPVVHHFNPECEQEVAAGGPTQSSAIVDDLRRDLQVLPLFLGHPQDVVLVSDPVSERFLAGLDAAGIQHPRFLPEVPSADEHPHLGDLRPWGWSPVSQRRFRPLFDRLVTRPRFFERAWDSDLARIHSKSIALPILRAVLEGLGEDWLCTVDEIGTLATSSAAITSLIDAWHRRGYPECVIKGEFGNSGRDLLRVRGGVLEPAQQRWVHRIVSHHGGVVVEPWLDRVCDISLRLNIDTPGRPRVLGLGRSLVDGRGQYVGGFTGSLSRALPKQLQRWASGDGHDRDRIKRAMNEVAQRVGQALESSRYVGPVGVDAMVYRDRDQMLRLKPVVEINPRNTMGHVCLALDPVVGHGKVGLWAIVAARELARAGFDSAAAFARFLADRHPVTMVNGRMHSGALPTTDPWSARSFMTVLFVAEDLPTLTAMVPPQCGVHRLVASG